MADIMTNEVLDDDPLPIMAEADEEVEASERDKALVKQIQDRIRHDKLHHAKAFKQMRRDMHIAKYGSDELYPTEHYRANLAGRHVKQKTAALYAKNPKAVAKRRETLDFAVWDENPQSLMLAVQTVQSAQMMQAQMAAQVDPMAAMTGLAPPAPQITPEMMQALQEAESVIADFSQGMERRETFRKIGKTLEILFAQALREQKPLDFKKGVKSMVRRACTTGVGYLKLGFQREFGSAPTTAEKLADFRARLDHTRRLARDAEKGEIEQDDAEMAELEHSIAALEAEPEVILREGVVFDYPQSTRVIPDRLTMQLEGFVGARHLALEHLFTADQVEEIFEIDLKKKYTGYSVDGKLGSDSASPNVVRSDDEIDGEVREYGDGDGLVCVWEFYDKASGLVYWTADGVDRWLRPPAAPDIFVEDFWPVYALTFNANENEKELFPRSDVSLIYDMQAEYNRSRQGLREHRKAARPRWVFPKGAIEDEDVAALQDMRPFEATGINPPDPANFDVSKLLQRLPVPGVDPNLYETGQLFTDIQLVVGSSEAQFGGTAQATATESAIAAGASASSDGSSVDELDGFLTVVARATGQVLLREMSPEKVQEIVGPGAVWPEMTLAEIADELFLEVEAGSSGKPNQAVELNNMKTLLPFLIQMPGINPLWLAKQVLQRMDDRLDLTEALAENIPSIVMQNQTASAQIGTGDPATDPASQGAQGAQGANNAPQPPEQEGSAPAFGSNQV